MTHTSWQLAKLGAVVELNHVSVRLDAARPECGLTWTWPDSSGPTLDILGVEFPQSAAVRLEDLYAREDDLVATYLEQGHQRRRWLVYWRVRRDLPSPAAVELQISAQTELLDVDPQLVVSSRLVGGEVIAAGAAASEPGYLRARLSRQWDCLQAAQPLTGLDRGTLIAHRLFLDRLEKGVLLRSRVVFALVEPEGGRQQVEEVYQAFCRSRLPLTA
jgi:hypothetical protein